MLGLRLSELLNSNYPFLILGWDPVVALVTVGSFLCDGARVQCPLFGPPARSPEGRWKSRGGARLRLLAYCLGGLGEISLNNQDRCS